MDKYYTPEISEFHIGFECEYYDKYEKKWHKYTICESDYESGRDGEHEQTNPLFSEFRVKYLDKEDIKSLGFVFVPYDSLGDGDYRWWDGYRNGNFEIRHSNNWDGYNMIICKDNKEIFLGAIRNKSELKKIMQQVNISNG